MELKPCPFCDSRKLGISDKTTTVSWKRKRHVAVYCKECNTYGPRVISAELENEYGAPDEAKQKAQFLWNRRLCGQYESAE